jgi:hypothetical protein
MAALLVVGVIGLILLALTIWRPGIGCGVLALVFPVTTGIARGAVIPLLRPSEAILLIVGTGLVVHYLPRRRTLAISGLDYLVGGFAVGLVLIPALLLFATHYPFDISVPAQFDRWRDVFGPLQFLAFYLIFSRTDLTRSEVAICLNLALGASVIVGLVAIVQLTGILPGLRDLIETFYPPTELRDWESLHRPPSLLGHFSAVGAFAALNYTLALVLAAIRHPGFSPVWLGLAMVVNAAAVLASLTLAPIVALVPVTIAVIWYGRRIPTQLVVTVAAAVVLGAVLLSPFLAGRLQEQQIGFAASQGLTAPQSLDARIRLWEAFFLPALAPHIWLGTGTVLPAEIPPALMGNIDNEYLGEAFRAGVAGVALLIALLVGLFVAGLRGRDRPSIWRRSLSAVVFADAMLVAAVGISAQYLTYGAVYSHLAIVVGLLAAFTRPARQAIESPARATHDPRAGVRPHRPPVGVGAA